MTLVDWLLALGPAVIVPLGLRLCRRRSPTRLFRLVMRALPLGAAAAVLAVAMPSGPAATAAALVWAVVCAAASVDGVLVLLRERSNATPAFARAVSLAFLLVGAVWLVIDRLDARPLGLPAAIVQLTAVHFHYAGFGAAVIAGQLAAALPGRRSAAAMAATLTGPPMVAAGFAFFGPLQIAGAVVLTAGLLAVAWLTVRAVVPGQCDRLAQVLLTVSSVSVVAPMLLAVQWAIGANLGTPALSIPSMARLHGVANALGFTLCGLAGWLRLANLGLPAMPERLGGP